MLGAERNGLKRIGAGGVALLALAAALPAGRLAPLGKLVLVAPLAAIEVVQAAELGPELGNLPLLGGALPASHDNP
jgi:hypothetical protein